MTEFLELDDGTLAYDLIGSGPLVVLAHGIGDSRTSYRFVTPRLVEAGYRVAVVDIRGCGESSADWPSYTRTDIAGDLIALVRHLDSPAVLVGQSISGGAATIAAARAPELVRGIVELGPFTRTQSFRWADLRVTRYRRGMTRLGISVLFGSIAWWHRYLDVAFPGTKPADWEDQLDANRADLSRPGRIKVMQKMGQSSPADAGAQLANVACPALIIEGSLDPDWADPRAEGEAIVAAIPGELARLDVIDGAGHYPHTQKPDETVALMLPFLQAHARA